MAYCAPSSRPEAALEPLASDPLDPLDLPSPRSPRSVHPPPWLLQMLLHGPPEVCTVRCEKKFKHITSISYCTSRLSLKYVQTTMSSFIPKKNTGVVTFTLAKKALGDRHWLDMLDWESHAVSIVTWLDSAARIWCVLAMRRNVPRQT
jgi:hypothetical protein